VQALYFETMQLQVYDGILLMKRVPVGAVLCGQACGGPTNKSWQSHGDYMEKMRSILVEVSIAEDDTGMLLHRQSQVLKVESKTYIGGCELLP
jgi:hypothetical protein